jgi:hypothetical protein
MLMHHTRGADAQAALETPQFSPSSARGSGPPDDAAVAAGSLGPSLVTDPTYSLIRGGGEIDATDHSLRVGKWDRDFLETLLAMAGHDLRQPLQIITGAHEILAGLLHDDRQRSQLAGPDGRRRGWTQYSPSSSKRCNCASTPASRKAMSSSCGR